MYLTHLECTACERRTPADRLATVCGSCGMPLAARYDLEAAGRALPREVLETRPAGLWRLREVLPLADPDAAVDLGEGGTPLLRARRSAAATGVSGLWIKDEALNPTGSFKARGMAVAVSMARALGARDLAVPSAGNAGGALAAYGARAGLPVHVAMPRDVPPACRIEAECCGADVTLIEGTIADCGRWVRERAAEHGWFDLSTLREPYRVEGKKTMGYELAEQLGWRLPDVIVYPAGGGTGLVGMWKAFAEMRSLGWIDPDAPLPRMVAVQAAGCAPVVDAFRRGATRVEAPSEPATVAAGLRVPSPLGDRWMLSVIAASGGLACSATDDELLDAARELAANEGVFAAPEGGAALAAVRALRRADAIRADDEVVVFNTGSGLKYLDAFSTPDR